MIRITKDEMIISMPGSYGIDELELLQEQLVEVLHLSCSTIGKTSSYYWLFELLKALGANREQLMMLHPEAAATVIKRIEGPVENSSD